MTTDATKPWQVLLVGASAAEQVTGASSAERTPLGVLLRCDAGTREASALWS